MNEEVNPNNVQLTTNTSSVYSKTPEIVYKVKQEWMSNLSWWPRQTIKNDILRYS